VNVSKDKMSKVREGQAFQSVEGAVSQRVPKKVRKEPSAFCELCEDPLLPFWPNGKHGFALHLCARCLKRLTIEERPRGLKLT